MFSSNKDLFRELKIGDLIIWKKNTLEIVLKINKKEKIVETYILKNFNFMFLSFVNKFDKMDFKRNYLYHYKDVEILC